MDKHTQTIRRQFTDELFECVDHFVNLAFKGLKKVEKKKKKKKRKKKRLKPI